MFGGESVRMGEDGGGGDSVVLAISISICAGVGGRPLPPRPRPVATERSVVRFIATGVVF